MNLAMLQKSHYSMSTYRHSCKDFNAAQRSRTLFRTLKADLDRLSQRCGRGRLVFGGSMFILQERVVPHDCISETEYSVRIHPN